MSPGLTLREAREHREQVNVPAMTRTLASRNCHCTPSRAGAVGLN